MLYPSEDSFTFLIKLSSCTPVHLFQKNEDALLHKNLYMNVPNNIIFNSLMWEAMTVFSCGWMVKLWILWIYMHHRILLNNKRNKLLIHATMWKNLKRILLSENRKKQSPKVTRGQRMKGKGYKKATSGILGVTGLIEMFGILTASDYMNLHVWWNFIEINTHTHIHTGFHVKLGNLRTVGYINVNILFGMLYYSLVRCYHWVKQTKEGIYLYYFLQVPIYLQFSSNEK